MRGDERAIAGRILNAAAAIPVEHIHGLHDVATAGLKRLVVNAVDVRNVEVEGRTVAFAISLSSAIMTRESPMIICACMIDPSGRLIVSWESLAPNACFKNSMTFGALRTVR